ncbi:hypothetical protein MKX01_034499 [Papaver californicum]|nr:hypothetical protein MKX01_034499 [Papaver californicum]
MSVIAELGVKGDGQNDPLILTQASYIKLPVESVSVDIFVYIMGTVELLDPSLEKISRNLKPGGTVLIQAPQPATASTDKRKLLLVGYLELQVLDMKTLVPEENVQSATVKSSKPLWKIGSSFFIKKATPISPKVQHDDDLDLIDEDSLLTEEDLKKIRTSIDDCEVGSSKKACKNCTCGRAEAEEKVARCGLGDAFRCASCPYKGLPVFKLGEKIRLQGLVMTQFLLMDAGILLKLSLVI